MSPAAERRHVQLGVGGWGDNKNKASSSTYNTSRQRGERGGAKHAAQEPGCGHACVREGCAGSESGPISRPLAPRWVMGGWGGGSDAQACHMMMVHGMSRNGISLGHIVL